jgi:hypothetical protein
MDAEIDVAPLPVLLFWADALNLEVSTEASREDVRDSITRARHGLDSDDVLPDPATRKRKLDNDTLMVCETSCWDSGTLQMEREVLDRSTRQLLNYLTASVKKAMRLTQSMRCCMK